MTPLTVKVTRRAAREITKACEWWDANRAAAPGALQSEIERVFGLIALHPGIGARALNAKLSGVRRVHLSRVRYHLYYRPRPITAPSRFSPCGIPAVEAARACDVAAAEQGVGADPLELACFPGRLRARLNATTLDGNRDGIKEMIVFDVFVNGQRRCRAGADRAAVLTAVLGWVSPKDVSGRPHPGELWMRVGGIVHPDEHVEWLQDVLHVGDEISIKIVQRDDADEPSERKRPPRPDRTNPPTLKLARRARRRDSSADGKVASNSRCRRRGELRRAPERPR